MSYTQVALSRRSPYLPMGGPKVSGLMIANHTGISSLFERILKQFDLLIKRKGNSWDPAKAPFIQNYLTGSSLFGDMEDLKEEFDDSREVVNSLVQEYVACESPNYIQWGIGQGGQGGAEAQDPRM